jgi:hypothetical protein
MTAKKASTTKAKHPRNDRQPARSKDGNRTPTTSKTDALLKLLRQPKGASIAELIQATGWQAHSVRGALAGSIRKKGHSVTSDTSSGERRYRIGNT